MLQKEILLAHFPKLTPRRLQDLLALFGSADRVWYASGEELMQLPWREDVRQEFIVWKKNVDEEEIAQQLAQEQIRCVVKTDADYPPLLKEIYDPPGCLFVRGTLPTQRPLLAVVGPRKHSSYGQAVVASLLPPLIESGIGIVSGLAHGIDSIAHNITLTAKGYTLAVLAGGVDDRSITPRMHVNIAHHIIRTGGVISECPPKTEPRDFLFPRRNRIIAGMAHGTLVIEAGEKSGALITAACALDTNRDVFAIPQNITLPTSIGVNRLIQKGAIPVTSADDILDAFHLQTHAQEKSSVTPTSLSPREALIFGHLGNDPIHIDTLIALCQLPIKEVSYTLTLMELHGSVRHLGGMTYAKLH